MQVKMLDLQAQYSSIRDAARAAIDEVCESQMLTGGPVNERFEANLARYCDVKHAIGVSSGTDALLCSLMAIAIKPGDEVIVPSFTFFATAGAVARLGATPVFVDIERDSFNLNPALLERAITPRTRAIMPVHLFGQLARMETINQIACQHELLVIEDAAQAIGATRASRKACSWGYAGCLSFYPTKNLGAFGDAGAICTNDDTFADTCRKLRVHGMAPRYYHHIIGGMFRMASIQAAVLDVKLKHLPTWHDARRRVAAVYQRAFKRSPVVTPQSEAGNWHIFHQYVIRLPAEKRDAIQKQLAAEKIETAIFYPVALHQQKCFEYLGVKDEALPETARACREVLALPIYPELPEDHAEHVAKRIIELL